MGDLQVRAGGAWNKAKEVQVKVAGAWVKAKEVHAKVAGAWNKVWAGDPVVIWNAQAPRTGNLSEFRYPTANYDGTYLWYQEPYSSGYFKRLNVDTGALIKTFATSDTYLSGVRDDAGVIGYNSSGDKVSSYNSNGGVDFYTFVQSTVAFLRSYVVSRDNIYFGECEADAAHKLVANAAGETGFFSKLDGFFTINDGCITDTGGTDYVYLACNNGIDKLGTGLNLIQHASGDSNFIAVAPNNQFVVSYETDRTEMQIYNNSLALQRTLVVPAIRGLFADNDGYFYYDTAGLITKRDWYNNLIFEWQIEDAGLYVDTYRWYDRKNKMLYIGWHNTNNSLYQLKKIQIP